MSFLDTQSYPLWANVAIFVVGAIIVWGGGTRLARYGDIIAVRTGWGHAFVGMLLLGGITSLPEVATTVGASLVGNAPLAINNILGGVAMQIAILALADAFIRHHALTRTVDDSVVLLQGVLLIAALALTGVAIAIGDYAVWGIGVWTTAIFVFVLAGLYLIKSYEAAPRWRPVETDAEDENFPSSEDGPTSEMTTKHLTFATVAAGTAILVAGYFVAQAGDALAEKTGLGSSFMGAVGVAVATSLPEVSTTVGAMRIGQYRLAFSNIFGTNLFDVALLFVADVTYRQSAVLTEVGAFSQVAVLLGIILTVTYLAGIIERSDRTIFGIGYDSIVVIALYGGGVALLYTLR